MQAPDVDVSAAASGLPSVPVVSSGRILHLDELVAQGDALLATSVKTSGRLEDFDIDSGHVLFVHNDAQLRVDPTLCLSNAASADGEHVRLTKGMHYQIIGELDKLLTPPTEKMVLRARVIQSVDGRDEVLYEEALKLRRRFEEVQKKRLCTISGKTDLNSQSKG